MLSGCICIFIAWDEERKKLVELLQGFNIPLLVLLLAESEQQYGQIDVANLHILSMGKIQESLLRIRS